MRKIVPKLVVAQMITWAKLGIPSGLSAQRDLMAFLAFKGRNFPDKLPQISPSFCTLWKIILSLLKRFRRTGSKKSLEILVVHDSLQNGLDESILIMQKLLTL